MKRWGHGAVVIFLAAGAGAAIHVEIDGNKFFHGRTLKEGLPLDPKRFTEADLRDWKDDAAFETADLYRRSGFFDVKVDVDLQPGKGPEDWNAKVTVTEGLRYAFDTVDVALAGDTAATSRPAPPPTAPTTAPLVIGPKELDARAGKPYQEDLIFRDRRTVLRKYGDAGFVRAKVDDKIAVKPETKAVRVDYLVDPSYAVVFDTLLIRDVRAPPSDTLEGLTADRVFHGLEPYKRGDTVRVSGDDRLIEKLQYTGAFNYVRIKDSLLPGPENRSALVLFAEEHVPGNIRSSLFYENVYGPGVSIDASHNNVAGTFNQVRSGFSVAREAQRVYAGYGSPLIFGLLIRFDDDVDANWLQAPPVSPGQGMFDGDFAATNSARLTWPWQYWLRLIANAELDARSRLDSTGRTRSLNLNFIQTAAFSWLNQPLDPSRGFRTAYNWGNGGPLIEDRRIHLLVRRHNWLETQMGGYYYLPSLRQVKLAARLDGGRFFGEGGDNTIRFFLGGARSVRSYSFGELCPHKDSQGRCLTTGLEPAYFQTSYETRLSPFDFGYIDPRTHLKFLIPLELVPFFDFGKVWNLEEPFSFSSQSEGQGYAYGLGFRYPLLGIFDLRLDFAYGRPGGGNWPDAVVIDLAESF